MHIFNSIKRVVILLSFSLLFLFTPSLNAQQLSGEELDSLYTDFLQLSIIGLPPQINQIEELTSEDKKCGFGLVSQVRLNFENFTSEQRSILKTLLQRPTRQTSLVSPSGFFRIHYNISGNEVPIYDPSMTIEENVMQVAIALDSSYNFEVNSLGYPAPPPDNGEGGDDLYDVYITSARGTYGLTEPESPLGNEKYTSFIEIHYSFTNFFTKGLAAMRVTVAHELHHAIQMGNYILRWEDLYFYELTSTAFEEFVYDDVNDYFQYLSSYFAHPDKPMPQQTGYNMAIWNIYLKETFGFAILKTQWELMPDFRAITSINNSIINEGSALPREINKFGIWTFFTNYRAIPGTYFQDAVHFPLITPAWSDQFTPPSKKVNMAANPTTNNFLKFIISSSSDTLFSIISNGDASSAISDLNQDFSFDYELFNNPNSGERKLTTKYSSDFNVSEPTFWSVSEILNNQIVLEDTISHQPAGSISYAYPNPFTYEKNYITGSLIFLPADLIVGETVDFNVYSVGMQLFYNKEEVIKSLPGNQKGVVWKGLDNDGNKLASGVYIYVIKKGDDVIKGKVVIFNE